MFEKSAISFGIDSGRSAATSMKRSFATTAPCYMFGNALRFFSLA
jgi:hypothetical protein